MSGQESQEIFFLLDSNGPDVSTRAHLIHEARWGARVRCCAGVGARRRIQFIHGMNRMNNAVAAIFAISAGSAGSCVRGAADGEKSGGAYSRSADCRVPQRDAGVFRSRRPRAPYDASWSLHGSGTKLDRLRAKVTKPRSVEHGREMVRKALAGCELRRSLALEAGGKKTCGAKLSAR
jgi:hypothetical protein